MRAPHPRDLFLRGFQERQIAVRNELDPLFDALGREGLLRPFLSALSSDLREALHLVGHVRRGSHRELMAWLILHTALVEGTDLVAEWVRRSGEAPGLEREWLEMRLQEARTFLEDRPGTLRMPGFFDGLEPSPALAEQTTALALGVYRAMTLIMRLDGDPTDVEIRGFKNFWSCWQRLRHHLEARPSVQPPPRSAESPAAPVWGGPGTPIPSAPVTLRDRDSIAPSFRAHRPAVESPPSPKASGASAPKPAAAPVLDETLLDSTQVELDSLVGLAPVKEEIRTLVNLVRLQALRRERGLPVVPVALHAVFTGAPGTGKTTVARLYGQFLKALGVLVRGHLVETDRAGLVAGYLGQTAERVDKVVGSALDGVLFIDEAYALGRDDDYAREAVEALLLRMENHRDRLVVVAAGYPAEMESFLASNPGLRSRFPRTITFPDHGPDELWSIFAAFARRHHFELHPDTEARVREILHARHQTRGSDFGNAREARNLFERCVEAQSNRLALLKQVGDGALVTLLPEDIPGI